MPDTENKLLLPKEPLLPSPHQQLLAPSYYEPRIDQVNRIGRKSKKGKDGLNRLVLSPNERLNEGDTQFVIDNYNAIEKQQPLPNGYVITSDISTLNITFHKVLQYLVIQLKAQTSSKEKPTVDQLKIHFSTGKFLDLCGQANTKGNRYYFKTSLEDMLNLLRYSSIVVRAKNHKPAATLSVFSDIKTVRGGFDVWLGPNFAEALVNAQVTFFPLELFRASGPSYYIGCHMSAIYQMDTSFKTDKVEGGIRYHIISVKKLLESCYGLPSVKKARTSNWKQTELIRNPVEKALEDLFEEKTSDGSKKFPSYLRFEYCKAKGEPLTDEEFENLDFDTWYGLYVRFALQESPEGIERRRERIAKNDKRKKKQQDQIEKAMNTHIGEALAKQDQKK